MAYEVIILGPLHMPLYFLGTFTEYPYLAGFFMFLFKTLPEGFRDRFFCCNNRNLQKTAQSHPLKTAIPVHFSIIRF